MPNFIDDQAIKKFKSLVVLATKNLVTAKDKWMVRNLPNDYFERALREVYDGDLDLASDVMFNRFDKIDDSAAVHEVESLYTVDPAAAMLADAIENNEPLLGISDSDNDGALSQSITMELKRIINQPITVQGADYNPGFHGFSNEQVQAWIDEKGIAYTDPFTVLITDLGTNQKDMQSEFLTRFPQAKLIVMDHHKPNIDQMLTVEGPRSLLVSPFVKGGAFLAVKEGGGVSGGYLLYTVLKKSLDKLRERETLVLDDITYLDRVEPMKQMGKAANLLDGVGCDARLKPLRESEIDKAKDVASMTKNGRSFSRWLLPNQESRVAALQGVLGDVGVEEFQRLRRECEHQNHMARALVEVLPLFLSETPPEKDIAAIVAHWVMDTPVEDSQDRDYVKLLKPYLFNFHYENQFSPSLKKRWLTSAENCFSAVGRVEKDMLEQIRKYELITEISHDFAMITQSASRDVEHVFTPRQLSQAYHSMSKTVDMTVSSTQQGRVALNCKSSESMYELLAPIMKKDSTGQDPFPFAELNYEGHGGVGGLTVDLKEGQSSEQVLEYLAAYLNERARDLSSNRRLKKPISVTPDQIPIFGQMMATMHVEDQPSAQFEMILRVDPKMVFEDRYSLKKQTASELVANKEWEMTKVPLGFSSDDGVIMIPNQAIKTLNSDDFKGGLKIQQIGRNTFIANQVFTGEQLGKEPLPNVKTANKREQQELIKYYQTHYQDKEIPEITIPRQEAIDALQFTGNGQKVFEISEAVALGMLNGSDADAFGVLDVEADGASNAQCFNLGLAIYEKKPNSGVLMSAAEFDAFKLSSPAGIKNFNINEDSSVMMNEEVQLALVAQVVNNDNGEDIRISIKAQNLTNMTPEMLNVIGCSAEEAQQHLLNILKSHGKMIIQAHNLQYDNNIARVNYPELYEYMSQCIHSDSMVPARDYQIAYTNMQVSAIEKVEFVVAQHDGYNLTSILNNPDMHEAEFPSVKGTHVLHISNDEIKLYNKKTRLASTLEISREDLADNLGRGMKQMQHPKSGIATLMRMATVKDIVSQQPVKEVQYMPFESHGIADLSADLWTHFQNNYAYDMSPEENVHKFMMLPDVAEAVNNTKTFDELSDVGATLFKARDFGAGNKYDPSKKFQKAGKQTPAQEKSQAKAQAKHDDAVLTFEGKDVLLANANSFVKLNSANAERFANTWAYAMVLDHFEATQMHPNPDIINGVSEATGVSADLVKEIYANTYAYRQSRGGIPSYHVHETHNNFNLEGDAYQEGQVVFHMMYEKMRNPYLEFGGYRPVVEAMQKQMATATLKQLVRNIANVALDYDQFNAYGTKQLANYADGGVSIKNDVGSIARMKSKTLSDSETAVYIELPNFDVQEFNRLDPKDREDLEKKVETAVTTLILSNSRGEKKLTPEDRTLIEGITTHPEMLKNLSEVKEIFGDMYSTERESRLKGLLKDATDAILGNKPLKMSFNKSVPPEDLDMAMKALKVGIATLKERQNFNSFVSPSELDEVFLKAKGQYASLQLSMSEGVSMDAPGFEPLVGPEKSGRTRVMNALNNVLEDHADVNPTLASTVLNIKKDPIGFLLTAGKGDLSLLTPSLEAKREARKQGQEPDEQSPDVRLKYS
jgi:hypothetical protein